MRVAGIPISASLLLLVVAARSELDRSAIEHANSQASWQNGPNRWYLPMQLRADGCYVGPNASEPGSVPKPCSEPALAMTSR